MFSSAQKFVSRILGFVTVAWVSIVPVHVAAEAFSLCDSQELQSRQGLPNVFAKLQAGQEVCIAYLGGSITAQPGWRVKTTAWLKERFPESKITEIDAALGGTGSELGVFRIDRQVIPYEPDLLFVEFAVNDSLAALQKSKRRWRASSGKFGTPTHAPTSVLSTRSKKICSKICRPANFRRLLLRWNLWPTTMGFLRFTWGSKPPRWSSREN